MTEAGISRGPGHSPGRRPEGGASHEEGCGVPGAVGEPLMLGTGSREGPRGAEDRWAPTGPCKIVLASGRDFWFCHPRPAWTCPRGPPPGDLGLRGGAEDW